MGNNPEEYNNHIRGTSSFSALEWYAMMYGVYKAMPEAERESLLAWEKVHIDGSGTSCTSDWPGWEKYIGPFPQIDLLSTQRTRSGFIYLIQIPSGEYKIGRSNDFGRRIQELSTGSPQEFRLIHKIVADDMVQAEKKLHKQYMRKSIRGEWFHLTAEDVEKICMLESFESGEFVK